MKEGMKYEDIFAMPKDELESIINVIKHKCKNDEEFKTRLKENPTDVLNAEGIRLQPNIRFKLVESEEEAKKLPENVIPFTFQEQKKESVSPEDLKEVAGGVSFSLVGGKGWHGMGWGFSFNS
ncbi:hypothetical protein [Legionella nagasakiensis]|uniref:hypothetical protein n=1 Tax=Legionella nagasakiensis TaxID=535290 RepID=UPI001054EA84|nr:hypothetical protein [Legionella nagasakiensis]